MKPADSQHSPLSAWDELPIHQFPAPVRMVATTDPRAYERYWFAIHDSSGQFAITVGMGIYPNLGTGDAFVIVNHGGQHTTVRANRHLRDDRVDLRCGPFVLECVEPYREWRLGLEENDQGVSFDLRWYDTKRALFQTPILRKGPFVGGAAAKIGLSSSGYESFGQIEGEVHVDGEVLHLARTTTSGSRDHHWGQRNGVGGPAKADNFGRASHFGQWVEFSDWSIWGRRCLFNIDDERPGALEYLRTEHELYFDPETRHLLGGTTWNHLENGEVKEIRYEQVSDKVIYMRTAGYMGPGPDRLGTPADGYYHGLDFGDGVLTRSSYDISDPATRIELGGFEDHVMRATCDDEEVVGLIEVLNPVIYEWARDGANGFRLAER
ncbi:hypothetical protein [Saccharopolyspora shandongensis]|uniref:hypothetical protein n=1 Tax=Saccharopolyspora shandongensis TaxID=418495 RepID=UPI00340B1658